MITDDGIKDMTQMQTLHLGFNIKITDDGIKQYKLFKCNH